MNHSSVRHVRILVLSGTLVASAVHTPAQMTYSPYAIATLAGSAGNYGSADGTNRSARFYVPDGIAVDGAGNVYVADTMNHTIRRVDPAGTVTTLAGLAGGFGGLADGTNSAARFKKPQGIAVGVDGSL